MTLHDKRRLTSPKNNIKRNTNLSNRDLEQKKFPKKNCGFCALNIQSFTKRPTLEHMPQYRYTILITNYLQ